LWLGFSYEYGFFYLIGRPFQGLMKATDYIASAITWLPAVVLSFAAGIVMSFVVRRLEGFRSEDEIRAMYPTPLKAWIARDLLGTIFYITFVIAGFVDFLFGNPYSIPFIPLAFAIIWFFLCNWFFSHESLRDFSRLARVFILIAPLATLIALWHGFADGYRALSQVENVYLLKLDNDNTEKRLQLLRNLDQGLLFRDPISSKIVFYNWDSITGYSSVAQLPTPETLFCKLTGYDCKFIPRYP